MDKLSGQSIISFLEKRFGVSFPEKGIVAGQSVASAYFELCGIDFNPVYNDIDIFINDYDFYEEIKSPRNSDGSLEREFKKEFGKVYNNKTFDLSLNKVFAVISDYPSLNTSKGIIFSKKSKELVIRSSIRLGILNYILYMRRMAPDEIIRTFDLNCVQIAVDLKSKKLYKTMEFNQFLKNGIMHPSFNSSPHHTAIRMCQKLPILNRKQNLEEAFLKIGFLIKMDNRWIKGDLDGEFHNENRGGVSGRYPFFGVKKFNEFTQNHSILKNYFDLISHEEYDIYQLVPKFEPDINQFEKEILKNLNNVFKNSIHYNTLLEMAEYYIDDLMPKVINPNNKKVFDIKEKMLESLLPKRVLKEVTNVKRQFLKDNIDWLSLIDEYNPKLLKNDVINNVDVLKNYFNSHQNNKKKLKSSNRSFNLDEEDFFDISRKKFDDIKELVDPKIFLQKNLNINWLKDGRVFYCNDSNGHIFFFCIDKDGNAHFKDNDLHKEEILKIIKRNSKYWSAFYDMIVK